jgi:CubicO group peptidase (beta-lactamase class C family)
MSDSVPNQVKLNKLSDSAMRALGQHITAAVETGETPAVSLAVFHQDAPVLEAAWGWLDPETKQKPTETRTLFDLASVTKLYTTVAFLSLLGEEKVGLYQPIVDVLPEFGKVSPRRIDGGQDPHSKETLATPDDVKGKTVNPSAVNFFHLLTHTSGLPPWRDVFSVAPAPAEPPAIDAVSRQERWAKGYEAICGYNFVGEVDTIVRYSDIGLMLLGEAVARLHDGSGDLTNALQARVLGDRYQRTSFNPVYAGFSRDEIAPTEVDNTWRKRRVWGEVHDENAAGVGGVAGHAGLFSTAFEVALFGNIWLNHAQKLLHIDAEIAGASVELQAQTGAELRGLGWMLKSGEESSAGDKFSMASYGHTGFTGTTLWIDPKEKLVVALLTNRVYNGRERMGIRPLRRAVHDVIADWAQS